MKKYITPLFLILLILYISCDKDKNVTTDGITVSGVYAYNNNESFVENYGMLYSYEAAKSDFIEGWHLPSDEEWNILEETLVTTLLLS